MFSVYERNAVIGVFGGLLVFATLFVPVLLVQLRRYGRVSVLRLLGTAAASIYGVALVAYTLFPLPEDTSTVCTAPLQLIPFHFVGDIIRENAGMSWWDALRSTALLEYLFNIALFVPLGVIVRRFLNRGILVTTITGFAVSLLIESTQYTGIWGVYGCAYRFADVDDLIANTGGAVLGAVVAPMVLWWMPDVSQLRPRRLTPRPVTARRRYLGMLFDWAFYSLLGGLLVTPIVGVPRQLGAEIPEWTEALISTLLPGVLVFLVPVLRGSGATPGQRAVWLTIDWEGGPPGIGRRLLRVCVPLVWTVLLTIGSLAPGTPLSLVATIGGVLAVTEVIVVGRTHGRGIGTLLAGARFVDSRAPEPLGSGAPHPDSGPGRPA